MVTGFHFVARASSLLFFCNPRKARSTPARLGRASFLSFPHAERLLEGADSLEKKTPEPLRSSVFIR